MYRSRLASNLHALALASQVLELCLASNKPLLAFLFKRKIVAHVDKYLTKVILQLKDEAKI